MKRHEALIPLSREHHEALILAQLLKLTAPDYAGLPTDTNEKSAYALDMFNKNLLPHFKSEEKILSAVRDIHPDIARLTDEIFAEHEELILKFGSLNPGAVVAEELDVLGQALEAHIRKEERILFPMIQQFCPEEILQKLLS